MVHVTELAVSESSFRGGDVNSSCPVNIQVLDLVFFSQIYLAMSSCFAVVQALQANRILCHTSQMNGAATSHQMISHTQRLGAF